MIVGCRLLLAMLPLQNLILLSTNHYLWYNLRLQGVRLHLLQNPLTRLVEMRMPQWGVGVDLSLTSEAHIFELLDG